MIGHERYLLMRRAMTTPHPITDATHTHCFDCWNDAPLGDYAKPGDEPPECLYCGGTNTVFAVVTDDDTKTWDGKGWE